MRFALLSLALVLALLAATARAEDNFDNANAEEQAESFDDADAADQADDADEADDDDDNDNEDEAVDEVAKAEECSPDPKTETKTLGGKEISQETENISVHGRCVRVLKGGSPDSFTQAGNCARCKSSAYGMSCVGSPLAMSLTCDMVLGPDCHLHSVDKEDPTKACS